MTAKPALYRNKDYPASPEVALAAWGGSPPEHPDVLSVGFANAGTAKYASLREITEALYDSIFSINVKGLLFTVQKALPLLPDGASIILNASIVGSKGFPSWSVYGATKAARALLRARVDH
jgi:NAD(P)-dependent dehydrogenase (short-subunit alcohol dehydrogenase family)